MIRLFQKLPTTDQVIDRVQNNIEAAFRKLLQTVPLLDGQLITDVAVSATPTTTRVEHGLSRRPNGWIVVGKDADARVWDLQSANNLQDRYLDLRASADVNLSLWIF